MTKSFAVAMVFGAISAMLGFHLGAKISWQRGLVTGAAMTVFSACLAQAVVYYLDDRKSLAINVACAAFGLVFVVGWYATP